MEAFAAYGYAGLFLAAFLAATILPLSSEVVLVFLLAQDLQPVGLVTVATAGNVLGAVVNYLLGFWGSLFLIQKVWRISPLEFNRAKARFRKLGSASLLLAWMPLIGDPLTIVAGVLKVNILLFLMLVTLGKLARYVLIAGLF